MNLLYVLLFVGAVGQTPANLGSYETMASCRHAIREIYMQQTMPKGIAITPELSTSINKLVDVKITYQREYTCIKR